MWKSWRCISARGTISVVYLNLFKTLKRLKPDIVHTRNLGTMEGQVIAAIAGRAARVHGEHGRDMFDLYGKNRKYNLLRKAIRPFVNHFIAVSRDLEVGSPIPWAPRLIASTRSIMVSTVCVFIRVPNRRSRRSINAICQKDFLPGNPLSLVVSEE